MDPVICVPNMQDQMARKQTLRLAICNPDRVTIPEQASLGVIVMNCRWVASEAGVIHQWGTCTVMIVGGGRW